MELINLSSAYERHYGWKVSLSIIVLLTFLVRFSRKPRAEKLPPGPPGLPILGNLLQLTPRLWILFTDWKKKYGTIIHLNVAGQSFVVLGSHKAAADLLDRRASIYSDRPRNIVASELLCGGMVFAFAQHNDLWKRMRRGSHEALNGQAAKRYFSFQETESILLLSQLLKDPKDWDNHLRRASTSLVLSVIYGNPPLLDSKNSDILRVNHFTERALAAAAPGAFWVEQFTWLEHLPRWMCAWRRYAEDWFTRDSVMFEDLYSSVKERINGGDETPSVCATLVQDPKNKDITDQESAWLSATLYAAGAETTSGQLAWFFAAMVLYPDAQRQAQAEIDRVVGPNRLPTFQDYDHLPYVRALVKETMRWRGVAPLAVPHRLSQDDYYEGHFIPKNTICIVNVWALNHDPDVYGAYAEEFNPNRHLNETGDLKRAPADTHDESHTTYGFGRRICVGRHLSNNSMFIEIAAILWAFNISPAKDEDGKVTLPDVDDCVDEGLVVRPVAFPCTIVPRSSDVEGLILQTKEDRGLNI